jgi:predicted AAA+ superfamily ATPase
MLKRTLFSELIEWKASANRKPLLLRGARQVGKTHLVRELGKEYEHFLEINFEENPQFKECFSGSLSPLELLCKLEVVSNQKIIPEKTLLFFDEVQECPPAILALRYFYEKMPQLHVVATGSLLEFALEKVGVPVGRIEFRSLFPLSFDEFLCALNEHILSEELLKIERGEPLFELAHQRLLDLVRIYIVIGGLPEVVAQFAKDRSFITVGAIQNQLVAAYQQDFLKYAKKYLVEMVEQVFSSIPKLLGGKIKYVHIAADSKAAKISSALQLLVKARVVNLVTHVSGNGVPLVSEENHKDFKALFLDTGLALKVLGFPVQELLTIDLRSLVNQGQIVEQFVGQELLAHADPKAEPRLHYWRREVASANAELDYLVSIGTKVFPIEVKSGESGSLRSLHQFLLEKPHHQKGVRFYAGAYREEEHLTSLPLYAVGAWYRKMRRELGVAG